MVSAVCIPTPERGNERNKAVFRTESIYGHFSRRENFIFQPSFILRKN